MNRDDFFNTALMPPASVRDEPSMVCEPGDDSKGHDETTSTEDDVSVSSTAHFIEPNLTVLPKEVATTRSQLLKKINSNVSNNRGSMSTSQKKKKPFFSLLKKTASMLTRRSRTDPGKETEQPSSSKGAPVSPQTDKVKDKEVDFYKNPTLLSRLILHQKFTSAIQRVSRRPKEASIWICAKRNRSIKKRRSDYSLRQLPMHMATAALQLTEDPKARKDLNNLITSLIVANPAGAFLEDHEGNLPLQQAVRFAAEPATITLFLLTEPESVERVDPQTGHSLAEINQFARNITIPIHHKQEIAKLVSQNAAFWELAKQEVGARLSEGTKGIMVPSTTMQLNESYTPTAYFDQFDMATIFSATTNAMAFYGFAGESTNESSVPELQWDQLEQRAIAMEKTAVGVKEENYQLSKRIEQITISKMDLQNDLNQAANNTSAPPAVPSAGTSETQALQSENEELNRRLQRMQALMECTVGLEGAEDESLIDGSVLTDGPMSGDVSEKQRIKYDKLYQRHKAQKQNINVLRAALSELANAPAKTNQQAPPAPPQLPVFYEQPSNSPSESQTQTRDGRMTTELAMDTPPTSVVTESKSAETAEVTDEDDSSSETSETPATFAGTPVETETNSRIGDDLTAIIRAAAHGVVLKGQQATKKKRNKRGIVEESVLAVDNLDDIMRLAAEQEAINKAEDDESSACSSESSYHISTSQGLTLPFSNAYEEESAMPGGSYMIDPEVDDSYLDDGDSVWSMEGVSVLQDGFSAV